MNRHTPYFRVIDDCVQPVPVIADAADGVNILTAEMAAALRPDWTADELRKFWSEVVYDLYGRDPAKPLFRIVDDSGVVVPALPIDAEGSTRVADGREFYDLEQAAARTGQSADALRERWRESFSIGLPDDDDPPFDADEWIDATSADADGKPLAIGSRVWLPEHGRTAFVLAIVGTRTIVAIDVDEWGRPDGRFEYADAKELRIMPEPTDLIAHVRAAQRASKGGRQ